jgi:hypothetical protein
VFGVHSGMGRRIAFFSLKRKTGILAFAELKPQPSSNVPEKDPFAEFGLSPSRSSLGSPSTSSTRIAKRFTLELQEGEQNFFKRY